MRPMPRQSDLPIPTLREAVRASDREAVQRIIAATGFFRQDEIEIAVELVDTRLEKGDASGYFFVIAEQGDQVIGYACYGHIACTIGGYDLYWIAVDPSQQGKGIGRVLIEEVEKQVRLAGGRHLYIETSGLPLYRPTRGFYERCGYELSAVLEDFYDRDDDKWIWRKKVGQEEAP